MRELYRRQPVYAVLGFLLLASVPVFMGLEYFDDRLVDGQGNWVKSIKFNTSLGIYLLTLAFFTRWMREEARQSFAFKATVAAVAIAIIFESAWLWSAGAQGIRSHFNFDGGLYTILYPLSGLFAIVLLIGSLTEGLCVLRAQREMPNPVFASSIGWGLLITFLLTIIVAFPLTSPMNDYGGSITGYGKGFFGWRVEGGDLRAAHFFSTHALHFVPAVGFVLSRIIKGDLGAWLVKLVAAAYAVFVIWLMMSTMRGEDLPFFLVSPF
ncbi:hypothetical protein HK107_04825 [Parvularcula sp. ZS-1/3]|uniref:Uncharacterized protein n=1 Tax=Parvularcula mediterranea TaxID=2732508 RepID=A0A7Y3RKG1_9PROT|nr:hypothetical protein [Parvularcula mediterranea]NNU15640.1 hypothetical protein [Parvularcula mediterranea]